jgi:hypothetical protein
MKPREPFHAFNVRVATDSFPQNLKPPDSYLGTGAILGNPKTEDSSTGALNGIVIQDK